MSIDAGIRPAATLTVQEVAAAGGVAPSAVRFYEKHGLIAAERTAAGHRRFTDVAACRIKVAMVAQRVGLTIREITELLGSLPAEPSPADWGAVRERIVADAETRVADLKRQLDDFGTGGRLCHL